MFKTYPQVACSLKYCFREPTVCLMSIGLLAALYYNSRSFTIGYSTAILAIFLIKGNPSHRKKTIRFGAIAISLLFTICTFFVKTDSSHGRLLVYKISLKMLKDYFWTGIGQGRFGSFYLSYQYDYFSETGYNLKELLLADNTQHAFNDYLQFCIECGISGIVMLAAGFFVLLMMIKRAIKANPKKPQLLLLGVGQIACLLIAALFTHVFEQMLFQALFLTSLIILIRFLPSQFGKSHFIAILTILLLFIILHYKELVINKFVYQAELSDAKELYLGGFTNESLNIYGSLYRRFSEDLHFLKDYLKVLRTTQDNSRKEEVLKKVIELDNSNIYHLEFAMYYQRLNKIHLAEREYLRAVYTVPNRFVTRNALLTFYLETQQNDKAVQTAKELLSLPIKVPSERVDLIRANTKDILLKLTPNH